MLPTRRLVALVVGLTCLVVLAAGSATLTSTAWAACIVLLAFAAIDGGLVLREEAPSVECEVPARVRLGQSFPVVYRLQGLAQREQSLCLLDARPEDLGGDLTLGPLRVPKRGDAQVSTTWSCQRRGLRPLKPLQLLVRSPLGLFECRSLARSEAPSIGVLPDSGNVGSALRARGTEVGERPDRRRGSGLELDSLRAYVLGDDPRHLDWRATARAQRMMLRTYREERNYALVVAVDSGRLMSAECEGMPKLDHALNASVALAEACIAHGDRMGFTSFDSEVRTWLPVVDPRAGLRLLLDASLTVEPRSEETSYKALSEVLGRRQRKRSLIVVFSDFVESSETHTLQGYLVNLARRHVVLLVALRDPILDEVSKGDPLLGEADIYRRLVLQDLVDARETFLRSLTRLGVHTMDLRPELARGEVLSRYLRLRGLV